MFRKRIPYLLGYEQGIFCFLSCWSHRFCTLIYKTRSINSSQAVLDDFLSLNREAKGITSNSLFSNTEEKGSI